MHLIIIIVLFAGHFGCMKEYQDLAPPEPSVSDVTQRNCLSGFFLRPCSPAKIGQLMRVQGDLNGKLHFVHVYFERDERITWRDTIPPSPTFYSRFCPQTSLRKLTR